jgi:rifampicin phosphotransferase
VSAFVLTPEAQAPVARIGGKAAALSALVAQGFDVPAFIVLVPEAFDESGIKASALEELSTHLTALGEGPFAVRSSGREEDGVASSHAGQFLTVLDVAKADIAAEALKVWRSGATDTLKAYRLSRGLSAEGGAPAVIVQCLVRARAAGVAFSADPISGNRNRIVISAVAGLAERLVSGEVEGDDYVLDKASGRVCEQPQDGVLKTADLEGLHGLVVKVEQAFGRPQDIEWALKDERLYLLQARPITTLREAPIADEVPVIFDNSNIVESYPGLVSPLTYSFATIVYARVYRMFVRLVGVPESLIAANGAVFENMLGRIDGRVYYNLINWYRALSLLPGFSINAAHMETMMGVDEPLPRDIVAGIGPAPAHGFALVLEYARVAKVALSLGWRALRLKQTIAGFYARLNRALEQPASALNSMPLSGLAGEYRRIEAELLDRWDAPLINDFLCMFAFGGSRKLLEAWAGAEGLLVHNAIMIGQGDIVSAEPAQRIRRMGAMVASDAPLVARLKAGDRSALTATPDLAREVEIYLAKFGDRCTEELKLESITLDEDPTALMSSIAAAAQSAPTPKPAGPDGQARLKALFGGRPVRRFIATRFVAWAKDRVRDRENLRFERTRIFGRARKLFMAIGRQMHALGLLTEPADVLLLTIPEVLGAIEGAGVSADLKGLAALRRVEMKAAKRRPDPPARLTLHGAVAASARIAAAAVGAPVEGGERKGIACSAGVVRAKARIIRDPRTEALERGEILVARHTDPGWIAIFVNASAIVVERGSLLSHSAIVARELGIPCVVSVKDALAWVQSGETLEVDGGAGVVRKIDG